MARESAMTAKALNEAIKAITDRAERAERERDQWRSEAAIHLECLASVERERNEAQAAAAVMREAIEGLAHVGTLGYCRECGALDDDHIAGCRVGKALATDTGAAAEELRAWRSLRPEVQRFAPAMEEQLKANDHKGGWKECSTSELIEGVEAEAYELRLAKDGPAHEVLHEAADVANYAMMLADVAGGLEPQP
ncbi:MAG: hypothetical protein ACYC5O_00770 [Anaerolineae bacterium]